MRHRWRAAGMWLMVLGCAADEDDLRSRTDAADVADTDTGTNTNADLGDCVIFGHDPAGYQNGDYDSAMINGISNRPERALCRLLP